MTISAFILVALASLIGLMLRAGNRTAGAAETFETTSRTLFALQREIGSAAPVRWAGDDAEFVFAGSPTRLVFAHDIAGVNNSRETRLVAFEVEGPTLLRTEVSLRPDAGSLADLAVPAAAVVYRGGLVPRFAYYGQLESGAQALVDEWPDPREMPVAIRITFAAPDTGLVETSLRIPLRIGAEPGCAAPGKALCSFVEREPGAGAGAAAGSAFPGGLDAGWESYAR